MISSVVDGQRVGGGGGMPLLVSQDHHLLMEDASLKLDANTVLVVRGETDWAPQAGEGKATA